MEQYTFVQKLLSRITAFILPNNPKNKKRGIAEPNYLHVSTTFHEEHQFADADPETKVVFVERKGHTFKNPEKAVIKEDREKRRTVNKQKAKAKKGN